MIRSASVAFVRALAALGLLMLLVTVAPPHWYVERLAGRWSYPTGPVLIVLGSDTFGEDLLGESSYLRSVYALRAWKEGGFRRVILSGSLEVTGPMRDYLMCQGIPAEVILIEGRSKSTHQNALFTAQIVRPLEGPWVLLTSDFHMWRAYRAFTKAGLAVMPRPLPDAIKRMNDWRSRWPVFVDLAEESAKIAYYWVRGWV
jgi:uncharacterized SAM-binding protein YcdF (DUF218 family)